MWVKDKQVMETKKNDTRVIAICKQRITHFIFYFFKCSKSAIILKLLSNYANLKTITITTKDR